MNMFSHLSYSVNMERHIHDVVEFIEFSGFDVYEEFDDFTINSIMSDSYYTQLNEQPNDNISIKSAESVESNNKINDESVEDINKAYRETITKIENMSKVKSKKNIKCSIKKCKNKSLRNNICRRHLILNKDHRCVYNKCLNLKSISTVKSPNIKKYNEFCVRHAKAKRLGLF